MSINQVCEATASAGAGIWDSVQNGAHEVGSFCGRMTTNVKNYWNDSIMPLVQKVIDACKNKFAQAKEWAQSNPDTLRAVIISVVATALASAVFFRCVCTGKDTSKGDGKA